jgi:hypothetical protein
MFHLDHLIHFPTNQNNQLNEIMKEKEKGKLKLYGNKNN